MFQSKSFSWIIACLGNPGKEYKGTRHNVGFAMAELLAAEKNLKLKRIQYHSRTEITTIAGQSVLLMCPQTYMNLSGDAVVQAAKSKQIPPERILVITDDITQAPGKIRIRRSGSHGGHNGFRSIIAKLGTDQFPRIRIGVGSPPHPDYDLADWVLGTPKGDDAAEVEAGIKKAAQAVEVILTDGFERAMNLLH